MQDQTTPARPESPTIDESWQRRTALFLTSQGLSLFGSMLVQYAIIWHITLTTGSGVMLTLSTIASFLPQIVISLFAGVWADRYPRKWLIIGADALTAASTLVLAVCFLLGYRELWLILVVAAIRSVGGGIQGPAVNALLPQIVPADRLMRVNSINNTIQPFIMIVTPVLAGTLLFFSRLEPIFFIDVVTALLAISLLARLQAPSLLRAENEARRGYLDDLRAGLVYIHGHRQIRTLFAFFAFVFFLITPFVFLSPLLVVRIFGDEAWRLTANEVAFFAGSILGGVILTAWGGFKNRSQTIALSCALWAVSGVALGLAQNFVFYLAVMALSGLPMPFWGASVTTELQEMTEPAMQGRVFGVQQLIWNAVMPVGMLVFGPLADSVSVQTVLIVGSALLVFPSAWLFLKGSSKVAGGAPARLDGKLQLDDCVEC